MEQKALRLLLEAVRNGDVSPERAMAELRHLPFEAVESANIDHHREIRCGFPEVIYGEGKTAEDLATIFEKLAATSGRALATRATSDQFQAVHRLVPEAVYHERARCITYRASEPVLTEGTIALVAAGTADRPVIEEARVTCEIMDQRTQSINDVGVAGIHRLLSHTKALQSARVIVVAAGMEGALPGVIGGLVKAPVIAVPTSIGHGANFNGIAPLLTMLNACAPGVAVVNIDSGFSAGYLAAMINRLGERE